MRLWLTLVLAGLVGIAVVVCVLLLRPTVTPAPVARHSPPHNWQQPSLAELDAAISKSEGFLDGLYKPLDHNNATVSEYYGFPLRVYLTAYDRWVLLGEDRTAYCRPLCKKTTYISPLPQRPSKESFTAHFRSPASDDAPAVLVQVNWQAGKDSYQVRVKNVAFGDPDTKARVYLGPHYMDTFSSSNVGTTEAFTQPYSDRSLLQSFRYTFRHGTQAGHDYYLYRKERQRAADLANFLTSNGLTPNLDLRAPVWGFGTSYPDGMPYQRTLYGDCDVKSPAETPLSYPYSSKVCRLGVDNFINLAGSDTLVPAIQAIHVLNKGEKPDHYYEAPRGRTSAQATASWLESEFTRLGYGMPECTPFGCYYHYASGPRTYAFGSLQTILGYEYGDEVSKAYANRVAQIALRTQIGEDGLIHSEKKGPVYRPAQRGGSYTSWSEDLSYAPPESLAKKILDYTSMPMEYRGLIAANNETTFDAYAFLVRYRCLVYGKSCSEQIQK